MNILQSLHTHLGRLVSAFLAGLLFMLRYNGHTIRFALYMLPAAEYNSDNLREALQSLKGSETQEEVTLLQYNRLEGRSADLDFSSTAVCACR